MDNGIQLNASIRLYEDDPVDEVIIRWLDSMPRRQEQGGARARVYRRGIMREVRQALFEYAKKQNSRRVGSPGKKAERPAADSPQARSPAAVLVPPMPSQAPPMSLSPSDPQPDVGDGASVVGGPAFGPRVNFWLCHKSVLMTGTPMASSKSWRGFAAPPVRSKNQNHAK